MYTDQLKAAHELEGSELRRHAPIGKICGCKDCFCCACLEELQRREHSDLTGRWDLKTGKLVDWNEKRK